MSIKHELTVDGDYLKLLESVSLQNGIPLDNVLASFIIHGIQACKSTDGLVELNSGSVMHYNG